MDIWTSVALYHWPITQKLITFTPYVQTPQNKVYAPLLAKSFLTTKNVTKGHTIQENIIEDNL